MKSMQIANPRTSADLEIPFEPEDGSAAESLGIVLAGSVDDCIHRSVEAVNLGSRLWLEAGYLLLKAKSEAAHGEWEKLLQRHGLPGERANEFMRAAKFYTSRSPAERAQLLTIGKSKMALLARADAEVVDDLLANPEEEGLQNLSVRELRASLNKAEQTRVNLQARLNTAEARVVALEKGAPRLTRFEPATEGIRIESLHLQGEAQLAIEALQALFERAVNGDAQSPEHRLRMEHVWIAAQAVAARASDLLASLNKVDYGLAGRVRSEHLLTPDEAEHWRREWQAMIYGHHAAQAERHTEREASRSAALPRGRGRPSKAEAAVRARQSAATRG